MKKNYFIALFFSVFLLTVSRAQVTSTETFETETNASTSFTDNGQVFNITSQARGPFDIQTSYPGTGWNGTAADNQYIDNDGFAGTGFTVGFTISSAGAVPFKINSMYVFVSNAASLNQSVPGSLTIVGKLGGVTKFTATSSSGFVTSLGTNNGFTFINMTTYGGSNNSNTPVDQLVFTTGGQFEYVALDAFTWTSIPTLSATTSFTNASCNGLSNGRASVSVTGGTAPYTYAWAPSGGTAALATGLPGGITYSCTITDAASSTITKTVTVGQPTALSATTSTTAVLCNGGATGSASVTASGGTPSYFYSWAPSGGTAAGTTGRTAGTYSCTITDNNSCSLTKTVQITQPTAVATATGYTSVLCYGMATGSGSVLASGGTSPYTYTWSTGATSGPTTSLSSISGLSAGSYTVIAADANGCASATRTINITQPPALVTSTAVTNVLCNGSSTGSATITASGGTGSDTYLWSTGSSANNISGKMAGVYTCTVTDVNNCTSIKSVNITQPSAIVTSTVITNVACNGGSTGAAAISASGGAGGYSYLWSTGSSAQTITGLMAGVYTATVTDANSCTSIKSVNITQPSAIVTSTAITNVACNGGSTGVAFISASGGAGGYSYLWSTGSSAQTITGLMAGVYTATVTDANSCTSIKSANITQPSAIVTSTAITNVACNGGSTGVASISASGGAGGYSYLWSTGSSSQTITGLMAGVYTATVTDANSCTSIKSANITQPAALATTTAVTNALCNGGTGSATITATGGTPAYTYLWSNGGTASSITAQPSGVYTATVTDANGCTSIKSVNITQPAALVVSAVSHTNVACFGNNTGAATVSASGGTGAYAYDWTPGTPTGDGTASASNLAAGSWTCTVTDANNCSASQTFSITQPASGISASTATAGVNCFGGSTGAATVTASGGTGSYTYNWSPSGGSAATASNLAAGTYTILISDASTCTRTVTAVIPQPAAALSATATHTNVSCFGGNTGAASVSVTGGTAAYSYTWSPAGGNAATASGLVANTYTCTISDSKGCTTTALTTVGQPASALSATATHTDAACFNGNNGAASVNATGGTPSYSYNWSPSGGNAATAINLAPGVYTCTITDNNGCTATASTTVGQPAAALSASITHTNVSCNGGNNGATVANATGGTGAYSYAWSPSGGNAAMASSLSAGTYTCFITDANSCSASQTVIISEPAAITAITSQTNVSCNGGNTGAASLTASGGTGPYTYSWSPGGGNSANASNLAAGNYTIFITDANNCSISQQVTISQPSALVASVTHTDVSCNGGNDGAADVTASGGAGSYSYAWTPGGIFTTPAANLTANNYTVTISDANNCSVTASVTIGQPAALTAVASQTNVTCIGGGSDGAVDVAVSGGTMPYAYTWSPASGNTSSVANLSPGVYSLTVTDAHNCSLSQTYTLTAPAPISNTQNVSICQGQSLVVGTNTYTAAGTYTDVLVAANACDSTVTTILSVNALPTLTTTASSTVVCAGSPVTLTAAGATTYTWSNGAGNGTAFTPTATATYTVNATDANGCSAAGMVTVNVNPAPAVTASATHTFVCPNYGQTTTLTGGGANTYTWTNGVTDGVAFTPTITTTYTVTGTDGNNCSNTATITITTAVCIGIQEQVSDNTVQVYPNPFSTSAVISISDDLVHAGVALDLYDNTGRVVKRITLDGPQTELKRNELATGLYFYNIVKGTQVISKGKLVIQ